MPRNMTFAHTAEQCRARTKTMTRRHGWWFLKPGDIVQQVEKAQGLKKGEKIKKIHLIRIKSSRPEILNNISRKDVRKEGFPDKGPKWFVDMFCKMTDCRPLSFINRIEFEYLD